MRYNRVNDHKGAGALFIMRCGFVAGALAMPATSQTQEPSSSLSFLVPSVHEQADAIGRRIIEAYARTSRCTRDVATVRGTHDVRVESVRDEERDAQRTPSVASYSVVQGVIEDISEDLERPRTWSRCPELYAELAQVWRAQGRRVADHLRSASATRATSSQGSRATESKPRVAAGAAIGAIAGAVLGGDSPETGRRRASSANGAGGPVTPRNDAYVLLVVEIPPSDGRGGLGPVSQIWPVLERPDRVDAVKDAFVRYEYPPVSIKSCAGGTWFALAHNSADEQRRSAGYAFGWSCRFTRDEAIEEARALCAAQGKGRCAALDLLFLAQLKPGGELFVEWVASGGATLRNFQPNTAFHYAGFNLMHVDGDRR